MGIIGAVCLLLVLQAGANAKPQAISPEVAHFQVLDRKNPPAPGQILFIGSSSFTRWTDVSDYFPTHHILNRAFGGSTLLEQIQYAGNVVFPYKPKQIVIYCGENDFANEPTVASYKVADRFFELYRIIRRKLPDVPIVYVSMKPSPSRWSMAYKFIAANRMIQQFCANQKNIVFLSIWDSMLTPQGNPKPEIYVQDRLHMNAAGYRIWQPQIESVLIKQ